MKEPAMMSSIGFLSSSFEAHCVTISIHCMSALIPVNPNMGTLVAKSIGSTYHFKN